MRVSSILTTAPAFKFSSLKSQVKQDMLVSLPTYKRLTGNEIQSTFKIPMGSLKLELGPDADKDVIYRAFSTYI